jgi:hypothetical protein
MHRNGVHVPLTEPRRASARAPLRGLPARLRRQGGHACTREPPGLQLASQERDDVEPSRVGRLP